MIKILDEKIFIESANIGDSFRPSNFAFICVYGGELVMNVNNGYSECKPGSLIFLSPHNIYKIESYSGDLNLFILSIDRERIRSRISFKFNRYDVYQIAQLENNHLVKVDEAEFKHLLQLMQLALYYISKDDKRRFDEDILTGIIVSIIYIITDFLLTGQQILKRKNLRKEEVAMSFIELVSKNFRVHKDLSFYADKLSISIKYLSNCVREITKSPPTTFITDMLMNEAKGLLLDPQATVGQISDVLGFSDQYAFGKFFKKHTGASPTNYRRQNHLVETIV
ncbi:MAG: helix-turn-helix domain-containing protein [Pedobacter sp.]|uniref:helix-turn-helix domain-containing protein n=1 Tax=Pedobacter sp. TaxID=1411316 RepID=UPI003562D946